MAAIPSTFANFKPLQSTPRVESGKPVTSVTSISQIPSRKIAILHPVPRLSTLFAISREPEDACLTGGTRSLDRRLLALNLYGSRPAETAVQN